jgi:hypothetical protein
VTGSLPFPGENHLDVVEKKNQGDFAPASSLNSQVPAGLDAILARMLARHPLDRYQTASELIIDLERSGLSAPVPSFADPEQARRDPWVQACLTSGEPTRLDPEATPTPDPTQEVEDFWLVRTAGRDGKPRTARGTTDQVRSRLATGALAPDVAVRRPNGGPFRPASAVPEFQGIRPRRRRARKETPADAPEEKAPERRRSPGWLLLTLCGGVVLTLGGLLSLAYWLTRA